MDEERIDSYIELFEHRMVWINSDANAIRLRSEWKEKLKDILSDFEQEIRREIANKVRKVIKYGE